VGLLVCVGPSAPHAAEGATVAGLTGSSVLVFEDAESALAAIEALIRPGDHVLVKGSRGMRMERFVDRIAGGGGDAV
jgi:UDP-N-acetylmuramoyl-tripeptide--D-alanyl-D-alanine ligase